MGRIGGTAVGLVLSVAVSANAGPDPQQVTDERLRELMTQAMTQAQGQSPAAEPLLPGPGIGVELTVDEAVARALERNLDIAVERLAPQTFEFSLAALRATYRPALTSTLSQNNLVQLPTSQLVGGTRVEQDTQTFNFGMAQALPWGGGNFQVGWSNRRQESSNAFVTFNPQFNSTLSASLQQPLLRGFRIDTTRQQLQITQINRDISEIQLRATVTNTLANVRNAYWDLTAAIRAVDVARRSLALAEKLVDDNRVRVEVGTLAPIDIVQAEAEAATRRQAVAQAEATWRTAELALKRLIVSGTDDPLWGATLNPVDRPSLAAATLDLETAVRSALEQRTDLDQARRQLQSNDITLDFLQNQRLPAVDLLASYGLQGIGGPRFIRQGGLGGDITDTIPGGYGDALRLLRNRDFPNWTVQLNISYPLGTSAADAQYARARIQYNQAQAQIRQVELQVATEVTNIALQVQSNLKRVDAATAARELAERRLEAEESKFEVGMSTNFFVVQAQRDLADAQVSELRAQLDYAKSLVDFERVQQTSISRAGVTAVTTGGTTLGTGTGTTGGTGTAVTGTRTGATGTGQP
jgi:outer membrane protein